VWGSFYSPGRAYGRCGAGRQCTGVQAHHWAAGRWGSVSARVKVFGARRCAGKRSGESAGPLHRGCSTEGIVTAEVTGGAEDDVARLASAEGRVARVCEDARVQGWSLELGFVRASWFLGRGRGDRVHVCVCVSLCSGVFARSVQYGPFGAVGARPRCTRTCVSCGRAGRSMQIAAAEQLRCVRACIPMCELSLGIKPHVLLVIVRVSFPVELKKIRSCMCGTGRYCLLDSSSTSIHESES
jgi:hypothetical protein